MAARPELDHNRCTVGRPRAAEPPVSPASRRGVKPPGGAPTGADLIADVTAHALRQVLATGQGSGTYHLAAAGHTSWHAYASFVIDHARRSGAALAVQKITPIPTTSYPTPATRPLNSRLDTQRLRSRFDLHLADWRDGVVRMLAEIG